MKICASNTRSLKALCVRYKNVSLCKTTYYCIPHTLEQCDLARLYRNNTSNKGLDQRGDKNH